MINYVKLFYGNYVYYEETKATHKQNYIFSCFFFGRHEYHPYFGGCCYFSTISSRRINMIILNCKRSIE